MKLFQLVMWRMSTILVVILTCWAVLFLPGHYGGGKRRSG